LYILPSILPEFIRNARASERWNGVGDGAEKTGVSRTRYSWAYTQGASALTWNKEKQAMQGIIVMPLSPG